MTGQGTRGRGRRPGSGAWAPATPTKDLVLSASLGITGLRDALTREGCLNPVERAAELALHGRTSFYRSQPDEAVVKVTLSEIGDDDA